jgi:hypothetical protein
LVGTPASLRAGTQSGGIHLELLKKHELPNFCPKDYQQLSHYGRQALSRMRRRKPLIAAFWKQAELHL